MTFTDAAGTIDAHVDISIPDIVDPADLRYFMRFIDFDDLSRHPDPEATAVAKTNVSFVGGTSPSVFVASIIVYNGPGMPPRGMADYLTFGGRDNQTTRPAGSVPQNVADNVLSIRTDAFCRRQCLSAFVFFGVGISTGSPTSLDLDLQLLGVKNGGGAVDIAFESRSVPSQVLNVNLADYFFYPLDLEHINIYGNEDAVSGEAPDFNTLAARVRPQFTGGTAPTVNLVGAVVWFNSAPGNRVLLQFAS
ncbi:MAG: hypothetical protein V3S43_03500 [Acidimicrobiia bacterium]